MLGDKLLDKFSEYDLKEVDSTFMNLVTICAELHASELGVNGKPSTSSKWKELFKLSEDLDYLFFED